MDTDFIRNRARDAKSVLGVSQHTDSKEVAKAYLRVTQMRRDGDTASDLTTPQADRRKTGRRTEANWTGVTRPEDETISGFQDETSSEWREGKPVGRRVGPAERRHFEGVTDGKTVPK